MGILNIKYGDLITIAKELGFSLSTVKKVRHGMRNNSVVSAALKMTSDANNKNEVALTKQIKGIKK